MARRSAGLQIIGRNSTELTAKHLGFKTSPTANSVLRTELKFAASFLAWPVIGFVGAVVGGWLNLDWLAPLGMGGLFCHYWFDGRIWTRRSFRD
jgi:hypothetical protein